MSGQSLRTSAETAGTLDQLRDLAEQQAALRRVATLVAQGAEPKVVFTAVAVEASRILGVGAVGLASYDADTEMFTKIFGTHGQRSAVPDGATWPVAECPEGALAVRTGRPARVDDWTGIPGRVAARHRALGFGQAVAAPIIVNGSIWGHIAAYGEADEILPPGCEMRLADYTQLMATAIANAQARDELRGLAEQQGAALRRVATLVAQQAPPGTIFNAVAGEASRALRVPRVDVGRCHENGSVTLLGSTRRPGLPHGHTFSKSGEYVAGKVAQTGRTARVDDWVALPAPDAPGAREEGFGSVVGAPIMVDGALWGVIVVLADDILPGDTETRLTDFTHLVASSISNVHARNNLIASRARIVTASDETRRRIERNLHDGIQQRILRPRPQPAVRARGVPAATRGPGGAGRGRPRPRGRARGDPGLLPGPASGAAGALGPRSVPAGAGPPVSDPGHHRRRPGPAAPRADRDRRLLRRLRGARERRQALAGFGGRGDRHLGRDRGPGQGRRRWRRRRRSEPQFGPDGAGRSRRGAGWQVRAREPARPGHDDLDRVARRLPDDGRARALSSGPAW